MSIAEKLQTIAENESKVYEAGKQADYDSFWDALQQNGKRTYYWGAFTSAGWTDETFKPKYPIIIGDTTAYCFRESLITHIPKVTHLRTAINRVFYDAKEVQTIDCFSLPNGSDSFAQTFYGCNNLENLIIEGEIGGNGLSLQWSTNLTIESLRSIINALADKSADTSGTVWIVTVGSTNYAKLNEEDIQNITKKGWQFV